MAFVIPVVLLSLNMPFNVVAIYAAAATISLFFFMAIIYPKISKDQKFLEIVQKEREESKKIKLVTTKPAFLKVRLVALAALVLMGALVWYSIQIALYATPIIVMAVIAYYIYYLKQHPESKEFAENLEKTIEYSKENPFKKKN